MKVEGWGRGVSWHWKVGQETAEEDGTDDDSFWTLSLSDFFSSVLEPFLGQILHYLKCWTRWSFQTPKRRSLSLYRNQMWEPRFYLEAFVSFSGKR